MRCSVELQSKRRALRLRKHPWRLYHPTNTWVIIPCPPPSSWEWQQFAICASLPEQTPIGGQGTSLHPIVHLHFTLLFWKEGNRKGFGSLLHTWAPGLSSSELSEVFFPRMVFFLLFRFGIFFLRAEEEFVLVLHPCVGVLPDTGSQAGFGIFSLKVTFHLQHQTVTESAHPAFSQRFYRITLQRR